MDKLIAFDGKINIVPPLNKEELTYFKKFSATRRMDRRKGPYFVDGSNIENDFANSDVFHYDKPPNSQPGLWCKWIPTEDGTAIVWNGFPQFYAPCEWLNYLIAHLLGEDPVARMVEPQQFYFLQGHKLNGIIKLINQDKEAYIIVENNVVTYSDNQPLSDSSLSNVTSTNVDYNIQDKLIYDIMQAIKNRKQFCTQYEEHALLLYFDKDCISYPLIK